LARPFRAHAVAPGHFATEGDAYRFGIAPLKIEVLTKISGVSFDEARPSTRLFKTPRRFDLVGHAVPYIGKPALIANKKSAGRHKDLVDVEELERLRAKLSHELVGKNREIQKRKAPVFTGAFHQLRGGATRAVYRDIIGV
jgi:hypothetical protein